MQNTFVVIMAGGVGTRFWPFSRTGYPKQFHDVLGIGKSMLQQTVERFESICIPENIYIVTSIEYRDLVKAQLPDLRDDQLLLEPHRRNTAACVAYACHKIGSAFPDANIVVAPADHIVLKEELFRNTIRIALASAQLDNILVTLGIRPHRPDTGYGYIQFIPDSRTVKKVKSFTEKPHYDLAVQFMESGEFVWNSGIFVWNAQAIMAAIKRFLPEMSDIFTEGNEWYYTEKETAFIAKAYSHCKSISIDHAILEKADNVHVVLSDFGWSDLGTWKSLYEVSEKDQNNNAVDGKVILYDTSECIIKTPEDKLVVINGLKGYIVAEYDNVLLICRREEEQKVKSIVADAKEFGPRYI